jgi:hypothetical protein
MQSVSKLVLLVTLIVCGNAKAQDRRTEFLDESKWPAFVQDRPLKTGADDSPLTRLSNERYNAALVELRNRYIYWLQGHGTLRDVCENAQRVFDARIGIDASAVDRVQLLKEKLDFAEEAARKADAIVQASSSAQRVVDQHFAKYYRLDAELELARAKKESPKAADK